MFKRDIPVSCGTKNDFDCSESVPFLASLVVAFAKRNPDERYHMTTFSSSGAKLMGDKTST